MTQVKARGPNFIYAKKFIIKQYGQDVWDSILSDMAGEDAKIWRTVFVPIGTYPFSSFKVMTASLSRILGSPTDEEISKMYEYIADRSLNQLYKLFFKATSPSFAISNYPRLWERFFTAGRVEVPVAKKGLAEVNFVLPEDFLDWLTPACLGYSKKAVEMAGGRDLKQKQLGRKPRQDGEWEAKYALAWTE